jgi:hypothetical protein
MREIPWQQVAHVHAPEVTRPEFCRKCTCLHIVHVLAYPDWVWGQGIDKEQVCPGKQGTAFRRDVPVGIGCEPDSGGRGGKEDSISLCRRVAYWDKSEFDPEQAKRAERLPGVGGKWQE